MIANSFFVQDRETEILIPQDIDVTDSGDMYGLVVVMAHDKTQKTLLGINSTSTFAARIVFAHCKSSIFRGVQRGGSQNVNRSHMSQNECR